MSSHDVIVTTSEYAEMESGRRPVVLLSTSAGDPESVSVGDVVRAIERLPDGNPARFADGVVELVFAGEFRFERGRSHDRLAVIRWFSFRPVRRASSSQRLAVVVCACGHARQLHEDAAGKCTLCDCEKFST